MSILFDDDDDDFGQPIYVETNTFKVSGGVKDIAVVVDLVRAIPGLRLVPVGRDKVPLIKGWTDGLFWQGMKLDEKLVEWKKMFSEPNFAFALGKSCGVDGDLVVEGDNAAGEEWIKTHLPETPIQTRTRHGWSHRHFKPDLDKETGLPRGNYVDVLGSKKAWQRQAIAKGFDVVARRDKSEDVEYLAHIANERKRAEAEIPMGPLVDIKCQGGQAMAPGSVHETGFVYSMVSPWTLEAWNKRPTFDPKWFPDEVWVARLIQQKLASEESTAAEGRVDKTWWTESRKYAAALKYVERVPPSSSGTGSGEASKRLMRLATVLIRGFMLDGGDARKLAQFWGKTICAHEPWSDKEIEHKLRQAQNKGAMAWGEFLKDRSTQPEARLDAAERRINEMMSGLTLTIREYVDLDFVDLPADFEVHAPPAPVIELHQWDPTEKQELIEELAEQAALSADEVLAPGEVSKSIFIDDDDEDAVPMAPTLSLVKSPPITQSSSAPGYTPPPNSEDSMRRVFSNLGMDIDEVRREGFVYQAKHDNDGNPIALETSTTNLRLLFRFSRMFRGHFKLNKLGFIEEYKGKPLEDRMEIGFKIIADDLFGKEIALDRIKMAIRQVCNDNAYDSLQEYVDKLPKWDGVERWGDVAEKILHVKDDLAHSRILMQRFGLSAMARALMPGCKVDTMLVLQSSNQGWFKSTFVRELFSPALYTDQHIDTRDKDSRLLMSMHWGVELGEGEILTTPSRVMALKAFLSQCRDDVRMPYDRRVTKIDRRCVFIATTNETQILHDSTGDRRFWIVQPGGPADIDLLREWRDQLWAEAKEKVLAHLKAPNSKHPDYIAGQWWLTLEEGSINDEHNSSRRYQDAWESHVFEFLTVQGRRPFLIKDILEAIDVSPDRQDWQATRRMGEILRRLGCRYYKDGKVTRLGDKVGRFFQPPDNLPGEMMGDGTVTLDGEDLLGPTAN